VQPVSKLDQHHPHIIRRGQDQLPQALCPLEVPRLGGRLADLPQLRDSIHQLSNPGAKDPMDVLRRLRRVLGDIVKQSCCYGLRIEVQLCKDGGYLQGMVYVSLSRYSFRVGMRVAGHLVGMANQPDILRRQTRGQLLQQIFEQSSLLAHHTAIIVQLAKSCNHSLATAPLKRGARTVAVARLSHYGIIRTPQATRTLRRWRAAAT